MEATVTEIHEYQRRPEGWEEPLFSGIESNREVMNHYLRASWLGLASDYTVAMLGAEAGSGHAPVEAREVLLQRSGSSLMLATDSPRQTRRCVVRSGAIRQVLHRWREVRGWWESGGGRDLVIYRVELSSGAVVDLARDRQAGRWLLVGICD